MLIASNVVADSADVIRAACCRELVDRLGGRGACPRFCLKTNAPDI